MILYNCKANYASFLKSDASVACCLCIIHSLPLWDSPELCERYMDISTNILFDFNMKTGRSIYSIQRYTLNPSYWILIKVIESH